MLSARTQAEAAILCRNRRTGDYVFVNSTIPPVIGDLVAVATERGFRVELFSGQPHAGVVTAAKDYAERCNLLPSQFDWPAR